MWGRGGGRLGNLGGGSKGDEEGVKRVGGSVGWYEKGERREEDFGG